MRIAVVLSATVALFFGVALGESAPNTSSDVAQIRALRLENNRAILERKLAALSKPWKSNVRLIESDGQIWTGAGDLARSYANAEFKDPNFVEYVRIPSRITIAADGGHAAELGTWTAINRPPERVRSGTYLASWEKIAGTWKIVYEAYAASNSAPQSIVDVLHPTATFHLGGTPDWLAVTPDSVWVANDALKSVQRIDVRTNALAARVKLPQEPCSGLTSGFGSLWVPLCGQRPSLARVDLTTNAITAILPIGPALSEGGITASGDSVWLVVKDGTLARIDPATNRIRQRIGIATGSYNPLYTDGVVWITSGEHSLLTAVDATEGKVVARVGVGSKPRFLAAGDGNVWTLNQGDGTVSKVAAQAKRLIENVQTAIPGGGGDIAFGAGSVWATIVGVPLTRIDSETTAIRHWGGRGGDAVRFGAGSVWLTDYHDGLLWRIPVPPTP
jgi:virginiamycin B lyase